MYYIGGRYGSTKCSKFRITQILEITDPSLPALEIPEKDFPIPPTLTFGRCVIKDLKIGDYVTATSENDKQFTNFQRCTSPANRLSDDEILTYSMQEKAKMLEKKALNTFRTGTDDVDAYIDKIRNAMWNLTKSERAAFALYIYQRLSK